MKTLSLTLTSLAVLSLTACASTKPENLLFNGIAADKIAPAKVAEADPEAGLNAMNIAERRIRASASNPTCAQFNMNALAFAAAPEVPGFGTDIIKTIIMGTVAGAASGGIASVGIGSAFIETAVAGTTNQIVFNGVKPVVDKVVPDLTVGGSEKTAALKTAAERVDCPDPTWLSAMTAIENKVLLTKLNGEAVAAQKAAKNAGTIVSSDIEIATPALETPTIGTPTIAIPVPSQALPISCPVGTTAQPGGTCMVTSDSYTGG